MPSSPLIRWGLPISILAIALVLAIRQQQQPLQQPLTSSTTHCYTSIRTLWPSNASPKCFTVGSDGQFSDVFTPEKDEIPEDAILSPGHVIPGLWDGHGHLRQYGEFLHSVDLFGATSLEEVRVRVKKYIAENPSAGSKDEWVRGIGWDQTFYGRMPTADDLAQDPDLKGLYIMLDRIDVHCTWVSPSILSLLAPLPPSVPGGEIIREPGPGVFCDNAMDLVLPLWPRPSPEAQARQVHSAMAALNAVGLVGMHDAGETRKNLEFYREMAGKDEEWTVRVYGMLECEKRNTFCPEEAAVVAGESDLLTVRSIKLFADGALGSWGSAMLEPYADHPDTSGTLLINGSALTAVTSQWSTAGYQVNIHAIGDLANRNAIDAFSTALERLCPSMASVTELARCQRENHRFRIEHSQIIHPDDQVRISSLGIAPSVQPTHATSDMKYALSRLGSERLGNSAYRMRSFLHTHPAPLLLGSDFPVEPPNPFRGMYAAVARRDPATGFGSPDKPDEGWHLDEALTMDEALQGFTLGPAWGAFLEDKAGVIRPGAFADWVVLDGPLTQDTQVESLRDLQVRETWVGGKRVYARV